MNGITFSKRLYGVQGNIVFLVFTLSTVLFILTRRVEWRDYGLLGLSLLILAFTLVGTLGWRAALRRRSLRLLRGYFATQLIIFALIFALENTASEGGASSGNLIVLLLLQSSILSWRTRFMILAAGIFGMLLISLLFLPVIPVVITTLTLILQYSGVLLVGNLIVSEEHARQQLAEAHEKLTQYTVGIEELATMRERNRLAREIHDSIGHYLTIINIQIEVAKTFVHRDTEQALIALSHAQQSAQEGLASIRQSVAALRGSPVERNLLHNTIAQLVEEHRATGLNVDYRVEGQARLLSEEMNLTLYRVAQEGLTNIRKHAHAKRTTVALCYKIDRHVSLCIEDDGIGRGDTQAGYGLVGIKERVQLLEGTLEIETSAGQGFRLCVEVLA